MFGRGSFEKLAVTSALGFPDFSHPLAALFAAIVHHLPDVARYQSFAEVGHIQHVLFGIALDDPYVIDDVGAFLVPIVISIIKLLIEP